MAGKSMRPARRLVRRPAEDYITERVEAYEVAIGALRAHEPADGDPTGIASKLREKLAVKLDREIQRWVDSLPPNSSIERT